MLTGIIGFILGAFVGMILTALLVANGNDDDEGYRRL